MERTILQHFCKSKICSNCFLNMENTWNLHRKIYLEPKCNDAKEFMMKTLLPSKYDPDKEYNFKGCVLTING